MVLCTEPRPAFIPALNTAQAKLIGTQHGSEVMNVLYFTQAGDWTLPNLIALADELSSAWIGNLVADYSADFTLTRIDVADMEHENGPFHSKLIGVSGTGAAGALPNNVAIALTFRTASRGRSFRGRMFFPSLLQSNVVGDVVDADWLAGLLGDLQSFFSDVFTTVAATHVVASYCTALNWRAAAVVTPVVNYTSDGVIDSQRRRLSGRGI